MSLPDCFYCPSYPVKYFSCFMLKHFMTPQNLILQNSKNGISQKEKVLKVKPQNFFLVFIVLSFRLQKGGYKL